ncbi:MAG: GNAT family protein [Rhodothermales bacterium]|nr:GNAT family protein [Rhodothermales bacterium]
MALSLEPSARDDAHADPDVPVREVTLTPLHRENLYKHFEWNNDPELNRLDSEIPFHKESLSEFKRRFEQMIYSPAPDQQDFEVRADDGTVIGVAYIVNISTHHRHCTIGITIGDRDYWGEGYGRAALRSVLAYCFGELKMHRVHAYTFEYNDAWRRLVEWAGFTKEGTERDYLYRDGQFWNKESYAILEQEYRTQFAQAA